jgi:GNAT superfamily N-acetyltransferase
MYVAAEHRDRGVGTLLMTALLEHARELGLDRVVLSPTTRSIPFYERGGFRPAHDLLVQWFDR